MLYLWTYKKNSFMSHKIGKNLQKAVLKFKQRFVTFKGGEQHESI